MLQIYKNKIQKQKENINFLQNNNCEKEHWKSQKKIHIFHIVLNKRNNRKFE